MQKTIILSTLVTLAITAAILTAGIVLNNIPEEKPELPEDGTWADRTLCRQGTPYQATTANPGGYHFEFTIADDHQSKAEFMEIYYTHIINKHFPQDIQFHNQPTQDSQPILITAWLNHDLYKMVDDELKTIGGQTCNNVIELAVPSSHEATTQILVHEIGHIFGLCHTEETVMEETMTHHRHSDDYWNDDQWQYLKFYAWPDYHVERCR